MNSNTIKSLKMIGAYTYMYIVYILLFFFFAYCLGASDRLMDKIIVVVSSLIFFLVYVLINHRFLKPIISIQTLTLFETVLFLAMLTVYISYSILWTIEDPAQINTLILDDIIEFIF